MAAKTRLTSSSVLAHYDSKWKLTLAYDASPCGVGAVLSHVMDDGSEQPVVCASRSHSHAEQNYAQLDREALEIVFGMTKFWLYLVGHYFIIVSDHKPVTYLYSVKQSVPTMASAHIQRWALTLSSYNYSIQYKLGKKHANADVLSRLPLPEVPTGAPLPGDTVLLMECLQGAPVTALQIWTWTDRDPVLSKVRDLVLRGWLKLVGGETADLLLYTRRKF